MKHTKLILLLILLLFMLFANNNYSAAEDLIWHENKDEVFKMAKEQGKLIFLLQLFCRCYRDR